MERVKIAEPLKIRAECPWLGGGGRGDEFNARTFDRIVAAMKSSEDIVVAVPEGRLEPYRCKRPVKVDQPPDIGALEIVDEI